MAQFFKTSTIWLVDFRYDGRPRRWFKAFGPGDDVHTQMTIQLSNLYGDHAKLTEVRVATEGEETEYLRGDEPKNAFCPTSGRAPTPDEP